MHEPKPEKEVIVILSKRAGDMGKHDVHETKMRRGFGNHMKSHGSLCLMCIYDHP